MSNLNRWMPAHRYELDDGTVWLVYQTYEDIDHKDALFWVAECYDNAGSALVQLGPFDTAEAAMRAADNYEL